MAETISTTCCIAGGGPAGMMLGFLLARAGVDVLVLEKHIDFFRDFRGDTIHPSTLELIHELGLLPDLLALPHQKLRSIQAVFGSRALTIADFEYLPTECGFIAFMPQWDFLDFLARHARTYPSFELRMGCAATDLVESDGIVTGVRATTAERRAGGLGRAHRRRGRPALDAAPAIRAAGPGPGRADGRPLVQGRTRSRRSPTSRSAGSARASSSSRSTAATIGNAAMSSPRARTKVSGARASTHSAAASPAMRRRWRTGCRSCRAGTTSAC